LSADLDGVDDSVTRERAAERERQEKAIANADQQQKSLLRQARQGDPDDPFTQGLRESYNELESQKKVSLAAIAQLDEAAADQPAIPTESDLSLLEALPYLAVNLATAPRPLLRELFEATQLTVHVHGLGDEVTITVGLPVDRLPETAQAAERITDAMSATNPKSPSDLGQVDLNGSSSYPHQDSNLD
jgi:site-specific DNA recombinase